MCQIKQIKLCFAMRCLCAAEPPSISLVMLFLSAPLGTGAQVRNLSSVASVTMQCLLFILRCNLAVLTKATLRMLLEILGGYIQVIGVSPAGISAWDAMTAMKK